MHLVWYSIPTYWNNTLDRYTWDIVHICRIKIFSGVIVFEILTSTSCTQGGRSISCIRWYSDCKISPCWLCQWQSHKGVPTVSTTAFFLLDVYTCTSYSYMSYHIVIVPIEKVSLKMMVWCWFVETVHKDCSSIFTCWWHITLSPAPSPAFQCFMLKKAGGPGTRLHVLDVTNASKIINVGVVNRNARWKFYIALARTEFNGIQQRGYCYIA